MVFNRAKTQTHTLGCQIMVYNGLKCPENSGRGKGVGGSERKENSDSERKSTALRGNVKKEAFKYAEKC